MKLTKSQVKKSIQKQSISNQTIYYSYAQKSQATLSILKNQRLLIFNFTTGILYYINQPKSLPFLLEIPKPKNQTASIDISIVRNPTGTNQMVVQFAMKNQKNQQTRVEWNFAFQSRILAAEWVKTLKNYKAKKIEDALKKDSNEATKGQNNQVTASNNAFIHDTLGFSVLQGLKKSAVQHSKPQESRITQTNNVKQPEVKATTTQPLVTKNLTQSKFVTKSPQKQPSGSTIRIQPIETNIRNSDNHPSRLGYQEQKPKNTINQSNINRSNDLSPEVKRSQINNSRISNNEQLNRSKVTLRDELESILARSQMRQSKFQSINYNQRSRVSRSDTNNRSPSRVNEQKYNPQNDWNLKFLKQQDQNLLLDFQIYSQKSFFNILKEDDKSNQSIRCYLKDGIVILVANAKSEQAGKLKAEFRNYHFIMESTKNQLLVGVPLACLIQFQGLVALVKSTLPDHAQKIELTQSTLLDLKDLQRYTRIKNNILSKATLYDLSQIYQCKGRKLIYIDNLLQYLPVHLDQIFRGKALRPEHILDYVNNFMQGGIAHEANRQDMRILNQSLELVRNHVKQLAKELSNQDLLFANSIQLKNIMHQRGLNLKYLPMLYNEVTNKNVKKYINTIMVAKVVKDNLFENIAAIRTSQKRPLMNQVVENSYRLLIQGNTNISNELWKQISINFRKQFNIPMSNHDIIPGYFLNCLMKLIPAKYDLTKLNDKKIFFKQQGIINKGFVVEIIPKTKSYYRYTSQLTDKIDLTIKQEKIKQNFQAILDQLGLKKKNIPRQFYLSKINQPLKQYFSFYVCPSQFDNGQFKHLNLFDSVGSQPPTSLSLMTTKNYLDWCLDRQKNDIFKQTLEQTLLMIDFWFDQQHPYHCQYYQTLSNYYQLTGATDQSINFMKESLGICIRSGGVTSKKTGYKYYELAEKQLRAGRKNDSMQNFIKAKNNMQNYNDQSIKYPITLMKLSSLYLNSGQFENCIMYAKQAVQKFEGIEMKNKNGLIVKGSYDQYCIKAIQIMTRAFQIQNKKNQFFKIAQLCAGKYNKSKNLYVFEQMIKICLTAVIFKHSSQKCKVFEGFIQKLSLSNDSQSVSPQKSIDQLMTMSDQFNVMEKFMTRFQSLERIVTDINSRRTLTGDTKQFVNITKNMLGCIGEDYVYGLVQQKQFQ